MKKGFTLIELLSVIVLITLIISITYTVFQRQIESSKQKLYDEQIKIIETAGKDYNLSHINNLGVMLSKLIEDNLVSHDIINPIDKTPITGCVIFEENSYNQTEYTYESNLETCLINAYDSYNVLNTYSVVLLSELVSSGFISTSDITIEGVEMTGCIMLISGEAAYESNVLNCN